APPHRKHGMSTGWQFADFYDDPAAPPAFYPNLPQDSPTTPAATTGSGRPLAMNSMTSTGTYPNCSSAFLQRLANPNLPYNPLPYDSSGNADPNYNSLLTDFNGNIIINPYITVDWQSIDVHVFNGEDLRV